MRSVENLSKLYSDKVIFEGVSYEFPNRGVVFLTGASGSGKTTFLRILAGLIPPTEGRVTGFQNEVSYCFQEHRLFPNLTALENLTEICYEKANSDEAEQAKSLLLRLGFSPEDFEKYPSELSGGMKQRVAFARSVLYKKPVLILDEPIKEVDAALAKIIREIIEEEAKERLVLMVSHNPEDRELQGDNIIRF